MTRALMAGLCGLALLLPVTARAAEAADDPQSTFEAFWSAFDRTYALFEVKRADWQVLKLVYGPRVTPNTSRVELFEIFTAATSHLNDVHVTVRDDRSGRVSRSDGRRRGMETLVGAVSIELIGRRYAASPLRSRAGGVVNFTPLHGAVGYLRLEAFRHPDATADAVDEALVAFAPLDTVIVDVRHNGGGQDRIARDVASRFSAERRLFMTVESRVAGADPRAFDRPQEWWLEPGARAFRGRVIVLTDSRTVSAAENFVLAMRTIPTATVIGDVTGGAMADVATVTIANGWTFNMPVNVMRDAQGVSWEGVGVAPDLWERSTPADVETGRDRVLELALAVADSRRAHLNQKGSTLDLRDEP